MSTVSGISGAPGLYEGIDAEAYHAGPGVSKSQLDLLAKSPKHLAEGQRKDSPALALGRAVHCAILEPGLFDRRYFQGEDIRRGTKAWAELEQAAEGREILKPDEWFQILRMRDAVFAHPEARQVLEADGLAEASAYWIDQETGELCRCRPDWWVREHALVADLKTTVDASPAAFARSVATYRYHVQQAFYMDGLSAATDPRDEAVDTWVWIAVEKEAPFAVSVTYLPQRAVEEGRAVYRRDLDLYHQCRTSGEWPGYPGLIEIDLPAWAYST